MPKPLNKLSAHEAKEALASTRKTIEALNAATRHVQALYLGDSLDDSRPARALEHLARAGTALLSLEIELRGLYGSGQYPSSEPMHVAPDLRDADGRGDRSKTPRTGTKAPR